MHARILPLLLVTVAAVACTRGKNNDRAGSHSNVSSATRSAATVPQYAQQGTLNVAPSSPDLTALDPLAYAPQSEVIPPRPFLYSVDKNGLTITRLNDNAVVGT